MCTERLSYASGQSDVFALGSKLCAKGDGIYDATQDGFFCCTGFCVCDGVSGLMVCQTYEKKTYRDSNGRIIGVATTDSMGRTTCRDLNGRLIGTAKTDGSGRTTFSHSQGRLQGIGR